MIRLQETAAYLSHIHEVRDAVLQLAKTATPKERKHATLIFDEADYVLTEPFVLDAHKDPELKNIELTLICENGNAHFTSNRKLSPDDFQKRGDIYVYQFEKDENGNYPHFRDLYADGKRIPLCRSEAFIHPFCFSEEHGRVNDENLEGIYIPKALADTLPDGDLFPMEITLYVEWEFHILHILSVDRSHIKYDEQGNIYVLLKIVPEELYQYVNAVNKCLQPKNRECFLRNHPLFLKKGSFCYHHKTGLLSYCPDGNLHDITIPYLDRLFVFYGMEGVTLQNLRFTGATDKILCQDGYDSSQANVYHKNKKVWKQPEAAILVKDGRRFTVQNCIFEELGVNGLLMLGKPITTKVCHCNFRNIAMCAISIGEPVTVGKDPRNYSCGIVIENNHLENIGFDFPSAPAIDIFRVDELSICHNEIHNTAYSGISVGWEWCRTQYALGEMINIRDAEIAYNRITKYMQILNDGGGIYVVGPSCHRENTRFFNFMHDNFTACEKIKRTVRGYYLDGSASNWLVSNNVTSRTQRPVFAQFIVPEQFTWNNRIDETYSTEELDPDNHHPERNTLLGSSYIAPTLDELFKIYPKAKAIYEASGCRR